MSVKNHRFLIYGCITLAVAAAGLYVGKNREGDYLGALYERRDFTLLDDQGNFFHLAKQPADKKLLLVFTPDGIPPPHVKPFYDFSRQLPQWKDVTVILVTRTNAEVAKNFKRAASFPNPLLLDMGGTVGRIAGVWESPDPVSYWGYSLIDNAFRVYWKTASRVPLSVKELRDAIAKATP